MGIVLVLLGFGTAILASMGGLILIRRRFSLHALKTNHEVGGYILGSISAIYGVLLGFVVLVVWEQLQHANVAVMEEVNHIRDFDHLASGLAPNTYDSLHRIAVEYTQLILQDEWPAMAEGRDSVLVHRAYYKIWDICMHINATTSRDQMLYDRLLEQLILMGDARRLRLHAADEKVPAIMWGLLIAGGIVTTGFTFFFGVKSVWSQWIMTTSLAAIIAFVLLLIHSIDRPFTGVIQASQKPFAQMARRIETIPAGDQKLIADKTANSGKR